MSRNRQTGWLVSGNVSDAPREATDQDNSGELGSPEGSMVHARGLHKSFGDFEAVKGIDFDVRRGECFGFLGPNGAGKSSTMRMIGAISPVSSGTLRMLGMDPATHGSQIRARLGVCPQEDSLDAELNVSENLFVYGRYFGLPRAPLRLKVAEMLEFVQLTDKAKSKVSELSGGMKRRLSIARSLINDPQLLLLDEPTTGLDPQARHVVWERLKRLLVEGRTIILTTHFMDEAQRLCDRVAIMDHGVFIAEAPPDSLIEREIEPIVIEAYGDGIHAWFDAHARRLAARAEFSGDTAFCYCRDPEPLLATLADHPELRVLRRAANLEDVFLKLTGRDLRD